MVLDLSQIPVQATPFEQPLTHFAKRLKDGQGKVVAIGSSSTAGEGGIAPYPQRLLQNLRNQFPKATIDVINRGVGGEEAPKEVLRFQHDVFDLRPDLVIWQVGTNAVWQPADQNPPSFDETKRAISDGVDQLLVNGGIDVILMDLQYVPALLTPSNLGKAIAMVEAISDIAQHARVNVFRRFRLMQGWHDTAKISFDRMVDPGDDTRLHGSDWTTDKMTGQLAAAIGAAVKKAQASQG